MAGLIDMFRRIEAAEEHARDLRAEFGPRAEDHCKQTLARLGRRDAYRSHLLDVLRALPWISGDEDATRH